MAKLNAEEQKLLDKLKAKAEAPDAEDYEIRIKDGDKEAAIPASRAGSWVKQHFGIDLFDSEEAGEEGEEGDAGEEGEEGDGEPSKSYFRGKRGK